MNIRIAICQIECHPALYTSHIHYIEEPFVPHSTTGSLSQLATKSLNTQPLQTACLEQYSKWQETRIRGILDFLDCLNPIPDLILFPEGSLPIACLPPVAEWSARTGSTILAGSHTPQRTPEALSFYRELSVEKRLLRQIWAQNASNVMPIISRGTTTLLTKKMTSVFEQDITRKIKPIIPTLYPHGIPVESSFVDVLPLICSEALQEHNVERPYQVAAIVSFDDKPKQFRSYIQYEIHNRRAVLFCNDGAFGGSSLNVVDDKRRPNWLRDALPDGLPKGDSILVADLDLAATAVEVGTASPHSSFTLVKIASILYNRKENTNPIARLGDIYRLTDPTAKRNELVKLLKSGNLDTLQRRKAEQLYELEQRGLPNSEWWAVLGEDCLINEIPSLQDLEADLASQCLPELTVNLNSLVAPHQETAQLLLTYIQECNRRARGRHSLLKTNPIETSPVIDREREMRNVLSFLDNRSMSVLEVSGLPEIGKSSALRKALAESGLKRVHKITCTETSSPEFLVRSVLQSGGSPPHPEDFDALAASKSHVLLNALRSMEVLLIERSDLLLHNLVWRDDLTPIIIEYIINAAHEAGTKIVIETRRELPLDFKDPSKRARLRVHGFNRELRNFGVLLFSAQLRRLGLATSAIDDSVKEEFVEKLGGHPVAIALAADALYEQGVGAIRDALRQRKGFFLNYLGKLVNALSLSDEEALLLRLLCIPRAPVPREAVFGAVDFPAASALRNLIALGAVEVDENNLIEIAGILREFFTTNDISADLALRMHTTTAKALSEMAKTKKENLSLIIEAEFHAGLAGLNIDVASDLFDGSLATAWSLFKSQRYAEARAIVQPLLARRESLDLLRLAAQIEARCNRFNEALPLAKKVFERSRQDTSLLVDLAKIALTQYQEYVVKDLVEVARRAGVEDVDLLVVEGRMALRQKDFTTAERIFRRAAKITERKPWPFFYLGKTLIGLGEMEEAIACLNEGEDFFNKREIANRKALNAIRTQLGLAYLYSDQIERAAPIIESVLQEDKSPEAIRAYASLTLKRDGVKEAHEALSRLEEAEVRNNFDKCQFRLMYALFYLGIGDLQSANREFSKAHSADRSNVFVMMKWARTLYEIGVSRHLDSDETYIDFLEDCSRLAKKILDFDPDNKEGIALMHSLRTRFGINI